MGGVLESVHRRLGRRYLLAFWILALAFAELCIAFSGAMYSRYIGLRGEDLVRMVLLLCAAPPVVFIGAFGVFSRREAAMFLWLRVSDDAEGDWERLRLGVNRLGVVFVALMIGVTLSLGLAGLYLAGGGSPSEFALLTAGVLIGGTYVGGVQHLMLELVLRPVVREVVGRLPQASPREHGTAPLGLRLFLGLLALSLAAGTLTSALQAPPGSGAADGLRNVAIVIGIGGTFSLLLTAALTATILAPTADLLAGTRRVAAGDLAADVELLGPSEHATLARGFNDMVGGLREREALNAAFGSYVDPALAQRVLDDGEVLEGVEVEVTVLFCDIRDFTTFADRRSATDVVDHLNAFFALVLPLVRARGGHPNKLLGDGFLAAFGAPLPLEDHAGEALAAAAAIVDAVEERYGSALRVGVGLNSGRVVAGTMGSPDKRDYTLIGDVVNVASRVEQLTKSTGDAVLLTEATASALLRPATDLEPRGPQVLKGKATTVQIFALARDRTPKVDLSPSRMTA